MPHFSLSSVSFWILWTIICITDWYMYCKAFLVDLIRSCISFWRLPISVSAVGFLLYDEALKTSAVYFSSRDGEAYCPQGHHLFYITCENDCAIVCILCVCVCVHLSVKAISDGWQHWLLPLKYRAKPYTAHHFLPHSCVSHVYIFSGRLHTVCLFAWAAECEPMSWKL